ncbi:hypothetical protein [Agrobacterium tumefaciens]|uniref:hypothetical protein n=1 Tax=Agrobacterium tumefaciens TaxID=358 RepID=UPI0021D0FB59|nr:hypothetical protein [Agrobacterium tumefaciens]UXS04469.1 hypothetical protein FY156_23690 [Agrobacterium tumefaciens]
MRKSKLPNDIAADNDGRKQFAVADGVSIVNGKNVTGATVRLTETEALYDLSLGRVSAIDSGASSDGGA